MAPVSKLDKLRQATKTLLLSVKKRLDPRTYESYDRELITAKNSQLLKIQGKIELIKELSDDNKDQKQTQKLTKKSIK